MLFLSSYIILYICMYMYNQINKIITASQASVVTRMHVTFAHVPHRNLLVQYLVEHFVLAHMRDRNDFCAAHSSKLR